MITKVIYSETSERFANVLVNEVVEHTYIAWQNVALCTNLGDVDPEEHILKIKERFKNEPDDLILLAVKLILPQKCPKYLYDEHPLKNTLEMLKEVKYFLQNNSLGDIHLTNLPQHFWETLGECINDLEDCVIPENYWRKIKESMKNIWGFKIINPSTIVEKC